MIKRGKDYAEAVGAPHVSCCPLADSYDVLFQVDYSTAWKYMIETVDEASEYKPEMPLYIEPKYSETRVHCQLAFMENYPDHITEIIFINNYDQFLGS